MRTATALRDHLSRLDDHLMKVQKERGQAMREIQVRASTAASGSRAGIWRPGV
jgi:hypothetical protein